ncbi:MAG: DoxX family protein [Planctomycetales bacterium]|nr:DoxX family protein [Planctomycetales bacterium]
MKNVGRVSFFAVMLIVLLRIAIGWQLFYEGIWKIQTQKTAKPWTSAGYLKNSQGPLRGTFRNMAGDPDDLDWLDADKVIAKWEDWQTRFTTYYKLDKKQTTSLDRLLNGTSEIAVKLETLPDGIDLAATKRVDFGDDGKELPAKVPVVTYDAEKKQLKTSGQERIHPSERQKLIDPFTNRSPEVEGFIAAVDKLYEDSHNVFGDDRPEEFTATLLYDLPDKVDLAAVMVGSDDNKSPLLTYDAETKQLKMSGKFTMTTQQQSDLISPLTALSEEVQAYIDAVEDLYKRSSALSYKQRVRAQLNNQDAVGDKASQRLGEIEEYKSMVKEYERQLANAKTAYHYDHLAKLGSDLQAKRASLSGPIKALDSDLKSAATDLLTLDQLEKGSLPQPWDSLRVSDVMTIAGLTCLGLMLIIGLFTRFAAASAAFMLFSFYMAMPPLPGLPELPGPEHSLIVNKTLIEVFALAAIATLPSGMWFGLDSFIGWLRAGSTD